MFFRMLLKDSLGKEDRNNNVEMVMIFGNSIHSKNSLVNITVCVNAYRLETKTQVFLYFLYLVEFLSSYHRTIR